VLKKTCHPELVRLAGSLERIIQSAKAELVALFLPTVHELASTKQHCSPYLVALGLLLNRTPLYGGPETVVGADHVEQAFETLSDLDWTEPELAEIRPFFCAPRASWTIRESICDEISPSENSFETGKNPGIAQLSCEAFTRSFPVAGLDRSSLFGESLPPGLVIAGAMTNSQ